MNVSVAVFSEPWIQRLGWVLIHFIWQGTGIALPLAVVLRFLTRAASHVRYTVIAFALLFSAITPVVTWMAFGYPEESFVLPQSAISPVPQVEASVISVPNLKPNVSPESPRLPENSWWAGLASTTSAALPYVVGLWLCGVLILTGRLTLGWVWTQRLCIAGLPIQDVECMERFQRLMERMQFAVPVRLLQSAFVEVPTLIGWLRPTILIPTSVLIGLTPDQLEAILAHELAHVRRYDYLVNLFQTVIETILFYHPAVWWISRKLREERENCCDDIALEVMQDRLVYASALALLEEGRPVPLAMTASGGLLLQRIRRIAGANDRKVSAWPLWILIIGILSITCLTRSNATEPQDTAKPSAQTYLEVNYVETTDTTAMPGSMTYPRKFAESMISDTKNKHTKINDFPLQLGMNTLQGKTPWGASFTVTLNWSNSLANKAQDLGVKMEWSPSNVSYGFQFKTSLRADEYFAVRGPWKTKETSNLLFNFVDHPPEDQGGTKPSTTFPMLQGPTDTEIKAVEDSQSPLMKALAQQKYAEARTLLAQGADVNAEDKMGNTALAFFIERAGDNGPYPLDILQTLMERAKDPNPLGHLEFSTPPVADRVLKVSLMGVAVNSDPARHKELLAAVQMLLSHGAMFTNSKGDVESLLQASTRGDLPVIQKLVAAGTPVSSVDADGWSPLLITIALGYDDAANWLIDHGANVNAVTRRGAEDPLTYAADRGHDELVEKLIAHGAKPDRAWRGLENAVDRNDQRLFDDLIKAGVDMTGAGGMWNSSGGKTWRTITSSPLYTCIEKGQTAMAITLLNKGVDAEPANVQGNRNYAYWAVHFERPEILQALLDHGANPLLVSNQGETPLSLAQKSHPKLVPMLQAAVSQPQTKSETNIQGNSTATKALIAAAQQGDLAQVNQLLKQGANPKANLSPEGKNALFVAAENNRVDVLKLLLQNGADPNCSNTCGNAPIDWTLSRGYLNAATVLHDAGAKISPEGWAAATGDLITLKALANSGVLKKGKTDGAMHFATSMGQLEAVKFLESLDGKPVAGKFLSQAARSGNISMLDYILSRGANMKTDGGDAMDQAIIFFDQPESVKWLLAHGADPNRFSRWNQYVLAECKSATMVKILLDAGANPNGQGNGDDDMEAPLVYAPDAESVRLLVQHGANLKPKFKDSNTLIDVVTGRNSDDRSAVVAELVKEGADFDPNGNGATAMARAAAWNHLDTMQVLLDHGVSPNAFSTDPFMDCSALNNAAGEPSPEAVKFLLDHGADPDGDPREANTPLGCALIAGNTVNADILRKAGAHDVGDLSIAASQGDIAKVSELLKNGANINETDHAGNTPLFYSVRRGHPEVSKLLIEKGANVNPFNLWGQTAQGSFELMSAIQGPNRSELDWGVPEDEGKRRSAAFKELFTKHPADPNYCDSHGRTALHQAAFAGSTELPTRDKAHQPNPNLLDNDGNTPLLLAVLSPHASELVIRVSTSPDHKIPPQKMKDWNGVAYVVDQLIKLGAKLDLKMPNGQTQGELAMVAAVRAKNPQLIEVLRDAGVADSAATAKTTETASTTGNPATTSDSSAVLPPVIHLTFLDGQTKKPVPGVKLHVRINDLRADLITDVEGASDIKLPKEEVSFVSIGAKHEGYVPQVLGWQKHLHPIRFPDYYEVNLTPGSPISGKIVDEAGHPLAGSEVTALLQGPQIEADSFYDRYDLFNVATKTDAMGKWRFDAFPASLDDLLIRASYPNFQATTDSGAESYTTTSGLPLTSLRDGTSVIVLKQGQQLSGEVFGADGRPLAGANLVLGTDLWGANLPETKTDATGHFLFKGIPNGDHPLTVQAAGHKPQVIKVSIPSPSLAIHLAKGRILKGFVVDAFGKPYAGLRISIDSWKPPTPQVVEPWNQLRTLRLDLRTDATGRFVWDGAPDEPVTFYFADDAKQENLSDLPLQANDVEQKIVMKPAMHLSAKVVDKISGLPISHLRMTPGRILPGNGAISWETWFTQTYEKGAVDWQVSGLGDSYVFKIEADGYQPFVSDSFQCDMTDFQTTFQLVASSR